MHRPFPETTRDGVKTGVPHRPLRETMLDGLPSKLDLLSPCPTVKYRLPNLRSGGSHRPLQETIRGGDEGDDTRRTRICYRPVRLSSIVSRI